jgi:hypothetical protein
MHEMHKRACALQADLTHAHHACLLGLLCAAEQSSRPGQGAEAREGAEAHLCKRIQRGRLQEVWGACCEDANVAAGKHGAQPDECRSDRLRVSQQRCQVSRVHALHTVLCIHPCVMHALHALLCIPPRVIHTLARCSCLTLWPLPSRLLQLPMHTCQLALAGALSA